MEEVKEPTFLEAAEALLQRERDKDKEGCHENAREHFQKVVLPKVKKANPELYKK